MRESKRSLKEENTGGPLGEGPAGRKAGLENQDAQVEGDQQVVGVKLEKLLSGGKLAIPMKDCKSLKSLQEVKTCPHCLQCQHLIRLGHPNLEWLGVKQLGQVGLEPKSLGCLEPGGPVGTGTF